MQQKKPIDVNIFLIVKRLQSLLPDYQRTLKGMKANGLSRSRAYFWCLEEYYQRWNKWKWNTFLVNWSLRLSEPNNINFVNVNTTLVQVYKIVHRRSTARKSVGPLNCSYSPKHVLWRAAELLFIWNFIGSYSDEKILYSLFTKLYL